ncbi:ABC transporter permease [Eubacterium sp.]|uniref:ABC transporter permease n=1 Tax=Eubacterium sp. TaxID=142586 RepID=UPI003522ADA3
MKNPLRKRIFRELKEDFSKYLVIFLFMTLTIGFISGFLVAAGSMKTAYDESFEKYNIEDGHFVLDKKADSELIKEIEKENVTLYENFYKDIDTDSNMDGKNDSTLRVFKDRKEVNKICLMKGKMPENDNEIAIDRMYADNNKIKVGNKISVGNKEFTVSGLVALSDFSALFSDNNDLMFDAVLFGVAVVRDAVFERFDHNISYSYVWKYRNEPVNETKEKKMSDKFLEKMVEDVYMVQNNVEIYIPRYQNNAIQFTGDDIGGDQSMMLVLLYILIVIMAFVFAVTINHTITREAAVIGTLRASGYTRTELIRHYIFLSIMVSLVAAVIGNILGYTAFKYVAASMYYGSYSLPTYVTIWNGKAFILTTVVPLIIMLVVNFISLYKKLKLSPLKFIRRDLSKKKNKKAFKLPAFKFMSRFRLRIIFQNKVSYITLFVGIAFANILLMFGLMMHPLLEKYQHEIVDNMMANYQYVLKNPVDVKDDEAEKYCLNSLEFSKYSLKEDISIYGIENNSKYLKDDVSDGYYVSNTFSQKYRVNAGDTITLKEKYGSKKYKFKIKGTVEYPAGLVIFMSNKEFCKVFDKDDDYYTGYFSNKELNIKEKDVASCITEDDLTKTSRQLNVSMGKMFYLVNAFAVVLFVILIYLLTKLIIEKNTNSISMVKILGYNNGEIARLYLLATTWVVVISILLSMLISKEIIEVIYFEMMKDYTGWLSLYIAPEVYVEMFVLGIVSYGLVAILQFRKIKKVPMDEALKNVE